MNRFELEEFIKRELPGEHSIRMVLIDDDSLVRSSIEMLASKKNMPVLILEDTFSGFERFVPLSTPIYIDKNLANGKSGLVVAKELSDLGYPNLFIVTGEPVGAFEKPSYIKAVVEKERPSRIIYGE